MLPAAAIVLLSTILVWGATRTPASRPDKPTATSTHPSAELRTELPPPAGVEPGEGIQGCRRELTMVGPPAGIYQRCTAGVKVNERLVRCASCHVTLRAHARVRVSRLVVWCAAHDAAHE